MNFRFSFWGEREILSGEDLFLMALLEMLHAVTTFGAEATIY